MKYDLNYFTNRKLYAEKKAERDKQNRDDLKAVMDNVMSGSCDLAMTIYRNLITRNKLRSKLAGTLGVRQNSVSEMLSGRSKPSIEKFMLLILFACDELDIEFTFQFTEKKHVLPSSGN